MRQTTKHALKQLTPLLKHILLAQQKAIFALCTIVTILLSPLRMHSAHAPNHTNQAQKTNGTKKSATKKLFTAVEEGNILLALQAIDKKANVNAVNRYKQTPLTLATREGRSDLIQILLDHNAHINAQNTAGHTALTIAAAQDISPCAHCVHLLLTYKANINTHPKHGHTALALAASAGHTTTVHILLEHKAGINIKSKYGNTALINAAKEGHTKTVNLLLQHKANSNIQNETGYTALMKATVRRHLSTIETLILHGANVELTNNQTQIAYDIADKKARTIIENTIAKRKTLEKELGEQNWDLHTRSPLCTIEQFTIRPLASIICEYANPYHLSNQDLHEDMHYYIQNNLGHALTPNS